MIQYTHYFREKKSHDLDSSHSAPGPRSLHQDPHFTQIGSLWCSVVGTVGTQRKLHRESENVGINESTKIKGPKS